MERRVHEFRQAVLFFFSSRRRRTRYWRDWSSDVCSSELWTSPCLDLVIGAQSISPTRKVTFIVSQSATVVVTIRTRKTHARHAAHRLSWRACPNSHKFVNGSSRADSQPCCQRTRYRDFHGALW